MSAGCPYRWTGTMARVRGVTARSSAAGSIVSDSGCTSTKRTSAPVRQIASTVATNVNGTVITSSPAPMPAAVSAMNRALVPELTPTACSVPQCLANSCSNASTSGPEA